MRTKRAPEMHIGNAIAFVLGNIEIPLFLIALVVAFVKQGSTRARLSDTGFAEILWAEILFYCVGIGFIDAWLFHSYLGIFTAPMIGWRQSPFQWELAWAELGIAIVAVLSLWRGYEMRLAATLAFAIFSFGAAAQHIHQIVALHNVAPGNAGPVLWFGDLALPALLLLLAFLVSRDR